MNIAKQDKLFEIEDRDLKNNLCIFIFIMAILYCFIDNKYEIYVLVCSILQISTIIGYLYVNLIKSLYVENKKNKILEYIDLNLYLIILFDILDIFFIFVKKDFIYFFISYCIKSIFEFMHLRKIYKCNYKTNNIMYLYIVCIISNYFSYYSMAINSKGVVCISLLLKNITFLLLYKKTIDLSLSKSMDTMNSNLKNAINSKKELNYILTKRNKILSETNGIIEKKQDKYRNLLECVYGGVFMFRDNKLEYTNNIEKTLNISRKNIEGIDINEFLFKYFNIDVKYLKKSNNYISSINMKDNNLEVEIFLILAKEDKKIIYVQDKSDINENIKMQKELKEYLLEDEIKQNFFESISNELKKPINNVFEYINLNSNHLKENDLESYDKNRKEIKENCLKLIKTINNFIDFNKICEGCIVPNMQIYNIVEVLENIVESSNKHMLLKKSPIIFDTEEEEIYVKCDNEMINRIVLNIISSFIKYGIENEEIYIYISTINNEVNISLKSSYKNKDNIINPKIFNEDTNFNKVFAYLNKNSELGILLVKPLVILQNGTVNVNINEDNYEFNLKFKIEKDYIYNEDDYKIIDSIYDKVEMELCDI